MLLLILAVPTVYFVFKQADTEASTDADGNVNAEETVINVRAYQYWWEFEYPTEQVVTSQELVVPTDKKFTSTYKVQMLNTPFWVPAWW